MSAPSIKERLVDSMYKPENETEALQNFLDGLFLVSTQLQMYSEAGKDAEFVALSKFFSKFRDVVFEECRGSTRGLQLNSDDLTTVDFVGGYTFHELIDVHTGNLKRGGVAEKHVEEAALASSLTGVIGNKNELSGLLLNKAIVVFADSLKKEKGHESVSEKFGFVAKSHSFTGWEEPTLEDVKPVMLDLIKLTERRLEEEVARGSGGAGGGSGAPGEVPRPVLGGGQVAPPPLPPRGK